MRLMNYKENKFVDEIKIGVMGPLSKKEMMQSETNLNRNNAIS